MNKISIVIPVLNEEDAIPVLLDTLPKLCSPKNIDEIIVVDGGSKDATLNILKDRNDLTIIQTTAGRALQMNAGADAAKSDVLYFLHADSVPPQGFDQLILNEIGKGKQAGCFRLKFDNDHWWLKLAGWFTRFNWRICRGGDQSLFITKSLFEKIGGFNENYIIYEDNELIGRLYNENEFTVIQKSISTSARLYKRIGIWQLQFRFWHIHLKRYFGASPEELIEYYRKHIAQ